MRSAVSTGQGGGGGEGWLNGDVTNRNDDPPIALFSRCSFHERISIFIGPFCHMKIKFLLILLARVSYIVISSLVNLQQSDKRSTKIVLFGEVFIIISLFN